MATQEDDGSVITNSDSDSDEEPEAGHRHGYAQVTKKSSCCPHRFRIFIMMFFCLCLHSSGRGSFNIALVAMVNYTEPTDNSTTPDRCPGTGVLNQSGSLNPSRYFQQTKGEFAWSASQYSQLLSGFYYGYVVLQFPGGYLSGRVGGKIIMGTVTMVAGVITMLGPTLARISFTALMVNRVAIGLVSGPLLASLYTMASKWAPKFEITWLMGYTLMGFGMGSVVSLISSGLLIHSGFLGGWPSIFYLYGGLLVVWSIIWFIVAADSPAQDPTISAAEREYIEKNTDNRDKVKFRNPPVLRFLTSSAILSYWFVAITDGYGYYVLNSSLAIYMKQILAYDIQDDGVLMGLQYSAGLVACIFVNPLVDYMRSKGVVSTRAARVTTTAIGECSLALCLLVIGLQFECNRLGVVSLLISGQLLYGVVAAGFTCTTLDIAPQYSGTIIGIGNSLVSITGFMAPIIIGWITGESTSRKDWKIAFVSTAIVMILGVVVYAIFSTGEVLPWAKPDPDELVVMSEDEDSDSASSQERLLGADQERLLGADAQDDWDWDAEQLLKRRLNF